MEARSTADIHSALGKHVKPFADNNGNFSPTTVGDGLNKMHSAQSFEKGVAISVFNATHASDNIVCPVTRAQFVSDPNTGYAKFLHLGTTRVWNPDGSINEERWDKLVNFVTVGQRDDVKIMSKSMLMKYLLKCYNEDSHEVTTGRNNNALFSSKPIQGYAATAAWNEVYDRLTCGWIPVENQSNELEPYVSIDIVRMFFEDSEKAFQLAIENKLPIAKPQLDVEKEQTLTLSKI